MILERGHYCLSYMLLLLLTYMISWNYLRAEMEDRCSGQVNGDWTWWLCSTKQKKEADTRDVMLISCTWESLVTTMKVRISSSSSSVSRSPWAEHMDEARVRVSLVSESKTVTGCVHVRSRCPTFCLMMLQKGGREGISHHATLLVPQARWMDGYSDCCLL